MHILTNEREIRGLAPGSWLVEDMDAAQIMAMAGGGVCKIHHAMMETEFPYNEREITIIRPGRFGDLVLLTPSLREIKRRYPKMEIHVSCAPAYRGALFGLPYIDSFQPYPYPYHSQFGVYGPIASLENLTSLTIRETVTHMTDLFAERLGLGEIKDKKPDYFVSKDETAWAMDAYHSQMPHKAWRKRIAVQIKSSTPSRDYPTAKMRAVIEILEAKDYDVFLLGLPTEVVGKSKSPRVTNCAADQLTFRQSAAVLSTCDAFLGPDSSLIHVAGALGVPAVGLFSVVPWELRTKYCPTTFVIQAKKGCDIAPCFHAPRSGLGFPLNGPCQKERKCCALDSIPPEQVVAKIESMLN